MPVLPASRFKSPRLNSITCFNSLTLQRTALLIAGLAIAVAAVAQTPVRKTEVIPQIVITGKRMTEAEKEQFDRDEAARAERHARLQADRQLISQANPQVKSPTAALRSSAGK